MVGKAVTKKRPLSDGEVVTSILATLTSISLAVLAKRSQVSVKFLQTGQQVQKNPIAV